MIFTLNLFHLFNSVIVETSNWVFALFSRLWTMAKSISVEVLQSNAVGAPCIVETAQQMPSIVANEPRQVTWVRLAIERICQRNSYFLL